MAAIPDTKAIAPAANDGRCMEEKAPIWIGPQQ